MNGYLSIDCTGLDLAVATAQTLTGIYAKLQTALKLGKPIYLTGLVKGSGVAVSPAPCYAAQTAANTVTCYMGTLQAAVTSADAVTIGAVS